VRLGCGKCFSLCVRFLRILCLSPAATVASPWALELLRYIRLFRREKEAFSLPLTTHVFQSSLSVPCQRDWRLKKKKQATKGTTTTHTETHYDASIPRRYSHLLSVFFSVSSSPLACFFFRSIPAFARLYTSCFCFSCGCCVALCFLEQKRAVTAVFVLSPSFLPSHCGASSYFSFSCFVASR
jgi:hypothetical protein